MKKSIITLFVFMLMCTCILQCSASAKERKFKKQDISYHKTDNQASKLHVTGAGKVKYIRHNYVEKYNTKRLYWNSIGKKVVKEINTIKTKVDAFVDYDCVKALDDQVITVYEKGRKKSDSKLVIEEYDKKGKKIFSYIDKGFTEKECYYYFGDVYDDGDNIYYIFSRDFYYKTEKDGLILRVINKKSKKAKSIKFVNAQVKLMDTRENILLQNNKVYELSDTSINVYSFKGKKLGSYKLPEGKRTLYEEGIDKEEYKYMINNSFSVCGDDIYYVNKNGVYKCNTKKGKFQMFYDGAQDDYFGHDYGVEELCVKDKNTFYIRFADAGFHVTCGDSNSIKLIQYSR